MVFGGDDLGGEAFEGGAVGLVVGVGGYGRDVLLGGECVEFHVGGEEVEC